jgi:hypothetical protein
LLAKQRVNTPAAIDPDFDAQLRDGFVQINHIN